MVHIQMALIVCMYTKQSFSKTIVNMNDYQIKDKDELTQFVLLILIICFHNLVMRIQKL